MPLMETLLKSMVCKKFEGANTKNLISPSSGGVGRTSAACDQVILLLGLHWTCFWNDWSTTSSLTRTCDFFFVKKNEYRIPPYIFRWVSRNHQMLLKNACSVIKWCKYRIVMVYNQLLIIRDSFRDSMWLDLPVLFILTLQSEWLTRVDY